MKTILLAPITFALFLFKLLWRSLVFVTKFAIAIAFFVLKCLFFVTVGWIILIIVAIIGIGAS